VLIVTSLVVTLLNTGAIYLDSVIYGYYTYAYVFGKAGPPYRTEFGGCAGKGVKPSARRAGSA